MRLINMVVDNDSLFYFQIATGMLLALSELLGMSSCKYNGVLHFVFLFCHRRIQLDVGMADQEEVILEMQNSRGRDSISASFHSAENG